MSTTSASPRMPAQPPRRRVRGGAVALVALASIAALALPAAGIAGVTAMLQSAAPASTPLPVDESSPMRAQPPRIAAPVEADPTEDDPATQGDTLPDGAAALPPIEDLTMTAGASIPEGLDVALGGSFPSADDWTAESSPQGVMMYRQKATDCTVRFGTVRYEARTDDDLDATIEGMREILGADLTKIEPRILPFPYNPTGLLITTSGEPEYEIEFAAFAGSDAQQHLITAGRAIPALDRMIIIEFGCPDKALLTEAGLGIRKHLMIGLIPAAMAEF